MASLNTETFTQIDQSAVTATQAASSTPLDLTVGSTLRAIIQAVAGVVLWLQSLIVYVLTLTRAATSSGADLDSWFADFGFSRLPAVASTGQETFSRYTPTLQALVPVGAQVQTADGTQTFTVTADPTNPAYSAGQGGYVVAAGVSSVTCLVTAAVAGSGGNVNAGTVSVLTQAISGIDYCGNTAAFGVLPLVVGQDAESDTAYRARFVTYLAALFKATKAAIGAAITAVQAGLFYSLTENQAYNGTQQLGYFYSVVDDGSGNPPAALLTQIANAIDAVRPICSTFGVFAPNVITANVGMNIVTLAGYTHATVVAQVVSALQSFINTLPVGSPLLYNQLSTIAFAVPGVNNVNSITLNGGTADLVITAQQVIKAGALTVA